MDDNLTSKFKQRFSWIPNIDPLYNPNVIVFPFSIDCDNGWFDLLWKLCEDIDAIVKRDNLCKFEGKDSYKNFSVDQIKEKFGGLRFYTNFVINDIEKLIRDAEDKSFKTCEFCGKDGSMHMKFGWYKTLCKHCAAKHGYERVE